MLNCVQTTMNTNTAKLLTATLLAHLMCVSVVLSHVHAKDAVSLLHAPGTVKLTGNDITAKALGDLHHHIDKAGLKNIHIDASTTAGRSRSLNPLEMDTEDESLSARLQAFFLRLRVVTSLVTQRV